MGIADKIDYKIYGDDMQCVEIELDPHESVMAEAGALMYMDNKIHMETIFGDGRNEDQSFLDKVMGVGKRLITGESLFMTMFSNFGITRAHVAFAAPHLGQIVAIDLTQYGYKIICQKEAFLCSAKGINIGVHFQRKLGAGFFGGEGFIMQSLEGDGLAFVHAVGAIIKKELNYDDTLRIDTGCLVAMSSTVNYNIELIKEVKPAAFGGEGLFLTTLRGPGTVWLQSLPFSRIADKIYSAAKANKVDSKGNSKRNSSGMTIRF